MRKNLKLIFFEAKHTINGALTSERFILFLQSFGITRKQAMRKLNCAIKRGSLIEIDGVLHWLNKDRKTPEPKVKAPAVAKPDTNESCVGAIMYLNSIAGTKFRPAGKSLELLKARLSEGYSFEDIKSVIDLKCKEWLGTKMEPYLRPETLFNRTKFSSYVGAIPVDSKPKIDIESILEDV